MYNINDFFNLTNLKPFRKHKKNIILFQPSIANYSYGTCSLQAFCMKSEFYKKILNIYTKKRWSENITFLEDCNVNFVIRQFCNFCEYNIKIGYLYIFRATSSSHTACSINKLKNNIYYFETIFIFSILPSNKLKAIKDFIKLTENKYFSDILDDNKTKILIKNIINEIELYIFSFNKSFNFKFQKKRKKKIKMKNSQLIYKN